MNTETQPVMSAEDEAELIRLLGADSANMPTSMAVNQEQIRQSASSEVKLTRSKYYGVYHNNGKNKDDFAFRSALRIGHDDPDKGIKADYINLGYFNCEHTAGIAYNVAALNTFGQGAWLNPINPDWCDQAEYERFKDVRAEHIIKATAKMVKLRAENKSPRYVDLQASEQSAQSTVD